MIGDTTSEAVDLTADTDATAEDLPSYRELPRSIEAEMGLLGAIFVDNRALEQVAEFLYAEHFALTAHARIY